MSGPPGDERAVTDGPLPYVERRFTAQDGLSLYYRDYPARDGAGGEPAVLCLPGLTRNSKDFAALAEHLSAERRVVCPDYRGRGRSAYDPEPVNYVPPTYVNDAKHLMAACGLHRTVVVGTSLGGLLAMGLAVAAPTAIAGVVLNDVGPEIVPAAAEDIIAYVSRDQPQPDFESAVAATRARFAGFSAWTDADLREIAAATYRRAEDGRWCFDWDVKLAEPMRSAGEAHDLWALFGALRDLPVLAVRGALSDLLTADGLETMAAAHPDLTTVTVAGIGHAPRLTEPEALAAIDAFLARFGAADGG